LSRGGTSITVGASQHFFDGTRSYEYFGILGRACCGAFICRHQKRVWINEKRCVVRRK
jgi:hypothetical protein